MDRLGIPEEHGGMGWGIAGPEEMANVDGYPGKYLIMARTSEDQAFIAAARSDVPALVAEVERLRDLLIDAEAARDAYASEVERLNGLLAEALKPVGI